MTCQLIAQFALWRRELVHLSSAALHCSRITNAEVKTGFISRAIGVKSACIAQLLLRIAVSNSSKEHITLQPLERYYQKTNWWTFILFLFSAGLRLAFALSPVAGVFFAEEAFSYWRVLASQELTCSTLTSFTSFSSLSWRGGIWVFLLQCLNVVS